MHALDVFAICYVYKSNFLPDKFASLPTTVHLFTNEIKKIEHDNVVGTRENIHYLYM